ncbi:3-deoxy-7-phosphoheptulonate synthase [Pseudobacteriovorax antillogorgiicola]|uniref:Phospho-2-dehydro-3-deoxyheptonate aldolase n=1 Tax=Pseudobacteriovorax antillogorgiicola TaxID=1513793 RepID=A0A1Y6CEF8_9BACT|nr:3-deoxy-7-phosphoheptulonate synthase [Pseudobacteriovorax antillogorgiicola]TCS51799.1 3-deoxy-D-arabinoheptulosonate-7-phosphate synthase [Pseudobacteriovorax antillogorgiicola]SMF50071.1 3-deoxy-D-arabinoheptulosonate-7-phosphate synthase [Pseudobacteriovorax antillogorgiicola]
MSQKSSNTHIREFEALISPVEMRKAHPAPNTVIDQVLDYRSQIRSALQGDDPRLLVIVGPCSFHDQKAGLEYANKLNKLRQELEDKLFIIMRVYFEKPRTTVGWKGLINDPHLDDSQDMAAGIRKARQALISIAELGLPAATEFLDPIVPQYTSDLVSWAAIGARTTESQTHREMASGLSMPVGFKNATDGSLDIAANAMVSAQAPHAFLGIDSQGHTSIVRTKGNKDVHIILRGGGGQPNYDRKSIQTAKSLLKAEPNARRIMIDCSHGNSNKDYRRQPEVFEEVIETINQGEQSILGLMLESFLVGGKQSLDQRPLTYGQSVTDGCIDFETTEALLRKAHSSLHI